MDVQMPVMDGYEACRRIRELEKQRARKEVPIIAMTANAYREDVERAKEAGMNGHLAKPIDIKTVIKTLNTILKEEN
jgi:CheY-like chemotaxis protein